MSSPRGLCDRDRCRAPLKRGKMTGAISLLFSAMALQDEGCVCICERESESERDRVWGTHTQKCEGEAEGARWGLINQACIEQESPRGSCLGRQVSIALWSRGYGQTHQSSHTTHAHKETQAELKLPRNKPHFLPLVPHYHVTALCLVFGSDVMWNTNVIKSRKRAAIQATVVNTLPLIMQLLIVFSSQFIKKQIWHL